MKNITTGVIISLAMTVAARGEVVLDQQHSFESSVASSTNGDVSQMGQTFTVGVAGTLDHIDVFMFRLPGIFDPTGNPWLRVYNTSGGLPTGAALASVIIPEVSVPLNNAAFVSFDVSSAAIDVDIGEVLAFSVTATAGTGPYFLLTDQGSPAAVEYPGGAAIAKFGENPWQQIPPPQDHSFRTYVDAAAAEELFGDYSGNDVIDAADYAVWRKTLAAGGTVLLHDATPGVVDDNDYNYWKAHFGDTPAGSAASLTSTAVPEPPSLALTTAALVLLALANGRCVRAW